YVARVAPFFQPRNAEDDHERVLLAMARATEAHADAAIGRADRAGALRPFVSPDELRTERAGQARPKVSLAFGKAANRGGRFVFGRSESRARVTLLRSGGRKREHENGKRAGSG